MSARSTRALLVAAFLLAAAARSHAVPSDWAVTPSKGNGNPTAAVTYFDAGIASSTFYAVDKTLYGVVSGSPSGTAIGPPVSATKAIENFPSVVPLADGNKYLFVASQDGFLYKVDAKTMVTALTKDLRRPGCTTDALQATPTVQLAAYSTGFTPNKDLVYVATYHACGDTTQNQIVALAASNLAVQWTFNAGEYEMDYVAEGCSLDYDDNRLYCGSNLSTGAYQNTVWAINTNDGSLVWAGNFNSVRTRPQLGRGPNNHLYVADYLGNLHAVDKDTGLESWSLPLTSGYMSGAETAYIATNMWAEFRAPYNDMLFVTDSKGVLHAVYDSGRVADGGVEAWASSFSLGQKVLSLGSVSPTLGKLYVGLDDGTVHQLDMATGSDEANRTVSLSPKAGDVVTDPTLHTNGTNEITKLVVSANSSTAGTITKQFAVPWTVASTGASLQNCTDDSECVSLNAPEGCGPKSATDRCCAIGTCNKATGVCYAAPTTDVAGKTCDDDLKNLSGVACTTNRKCIAGSCIGKWDYGVCKGNRSLCDVDPRRGCGAARTCVREGSQWVCVDPKTDDDYCGGASRTCLASSRNGASAWGGDRACNNGICERDLLGAASCATATAAQIQSKSDDASGLTFQREPGAQCDAAMTSVAASNNRLRKVFSSGGSTDVPAVFNSETHGAATLRLGVNNFRTWVSIVDWGGADPRAGHAIEYSGEPGVKAELIYGDPATDPMYPNATSCSGTCPFTTSAYNSGLSPPAVDGSGNGWFGNYKANGDLVKVRYTNPWRTEWGWDRGPQPQLNPLPPPWCPQPSKINPFADCRQQDRITSLDFGPDGILRIGHKAEVVFYNTTTQAIVKRVPIDSGWYGASQYTFTWVLSVSADSLNVSGQTFVEARDSLDQQHVLVIGPDYSVRFHSDMQKDVWGSTWPPRLVTPDTSVGPAPGNDGRMAAKAQTNLFRLAPPANPRSGALANVKRLAMPR